MKNKIFRIVVLVGLCFLLIINPSNALANKLPSQIVIPSEFSSPTERILEEAENYFNFDISSNISLVASEESNADNESEHIIVKIFNLIMSENGQNAIKHGGKILTHSLEYLDKLTDEEKEKMSQNILKHLLEITIHIIEQYNTSNPVEQNH